MVVVGTTAEVESEGFDRTYAGAARAPGRTGPPGRGGQPADRGGGELRRPGPAALGRRGGGGAADPGSAARNSATRWPTCCSGTPSPAGGCPPPGPRRAKACRRPSPPTACYLQRGPVHRLPRATTGTAASRCSRSVTAPATPPGPTKRSRWTAPVTRPATRVAVCVEVRNTGARPGREVVQLYASRPGSAVERPAKWLAGFAAVDADPGETGHGVGILIPERVLSTGRGPAGRSSRARRPGRGPLVRVPAAHRPPRHGPITSACTRGDLTLAPTSVRRQNDLTRR